MKYEDYLKQKEELTLEFEGKKLDLMIKFVKENNPYKIGDKITDHIGTILIEKIGMGISLSNIPCATYTGVELKKDGTPKKQRNIRHVWLCNVLLVE
jgi:hypothetical protein